MVFIECPKRSVALLLSFGRVMKYPSKFQKICYGTQCVFNYQIQLMKILVSLLVFIGLRNTLSRVKKYVMESTVFLGYPKKGITCLANLFEYEQYPSNSLDQNNSACGVIV